ncbi:putative alcohol dehydrogenase [Aspergillus floccosus]
MEVLQGKVNKAVIYSNPGTKETEVAELPIEGPGPGQVLVRMLYSGVCHTDYSLCTNSWKAPVTVPKGQIGGHEGIGEVLAQGPGVVTPQVGTKVGIKYVASACLACRYCLLGKEANCIAAKLSGAFHPGTFQQYLHAASNYVTTIPDNVTDDALPGLAPIMCAGITVYSALKNSDLRPGDWVAVSGGGGGLGHLAIQYAKAMGYLVVALDVGGKGSVCTEAGADHFVDVLDFTKSEELCQRVVHLTGGGARIALVCSSSNAAYAQAIYYLDQAGTLVCLGVPEGVPKPIETASVPLLVSRQIRIIGSKVGDRADAHECVRMAVNGAVKTHYQLRKMEELSDVFAEMEEGNISGRVVLDLR